MMADGKGKFFAVKGYRSFIACCVCGKSERYVTDPPDWFVFRPISAEHTVCGECVRKQSGSPTATPLGAMVLALQALRSALVTLLDLGALPAGEAWERETHRLIAQADAALELVERGGQ